LRCKRHKSRTSLGLAGRSPCRFRRGSFVVPS
jgi:hypothetical protein